MVSSKIKCASHPIIILVYLFGSTSLLFFSIFLFMGSFSLINLGLSETAALLFDTALSFAFFIQHSTMNRASFKRQLAKLIQPAFHKAVYGVSSGMVLFILFIFWQPSSHVLMTYQGIFRWFMHAAFFLAIVGFYWGTRSLKHFDVLGVREISYHINGKQPYHPAPLTIHGPYRWVRHPFYFFVMIMIWSCPDLTTDRLLFNVLWSLWIIIGGLLEERDLSALFGDEYTRYQKKVPMFFPHSIYPYTWDQTCPGDKCSKQPKS